VETAFGSSELQHPGPWRAPAGGFQNWPKKPVAAMDSVLTVTPGAFPARLNAASATIEPAMVTVIWKRWDAAPCQ
jgi:hypothetical protein